MHNLVLSTFITVFVIVVAANQVQFVFDSVVRPEGFFLRTKAFLETPRCALLEDEVAKPKGTIMIRV